MDFQFNTANDVAGPDGLRQRAEDVVRQKLDRITELLTRAELHISDVNGVRSGPDDKRAMLEIRPRGQDPISVTHDADTALAATAGAADKAMTAFERERGKRTNRKGH